MKKLFCLTILILLLCGCSRPPEQHQLKWVTQVTADYQKGTIRLHRDYTDDEKIRPVLDYFRSLSPYGTAQSVPQEGQYAQITIHYSDGSQKVYEQTSDAFLRQNGGIWQHIDPEKGQELWLLLALTESDEIF